MRPLLRALAVVVLTSSSLVVTQFALAQSANYSTYLFGERAMGMGGAFTGLATDASASFYNPGGLAFQSRSQISASVSLNAISRVELDNGFTSEIGDADLVHKFNGSVPLFVGLVRKVGSEEEFGFGRHALGFSTVFPSAGGRVFEATIRGDNHDVASLAIERNDGVAWYGLSYAYLVSETFGLGITTYLGVRNFRHTETRFVRLLGDPIEPGVYDEAAGGSSRSSTYLSGYNIMFNVGGLWRIRPDWFVGLTVQPPGIPLTSSARISELTTTIDIHGEGSQLEFLDATVDGLESDIPTPWIVRLGTSFVPVEDFTAAFDIAFYGPVGSEDDPIRQFGTPAVPEGAPNAPYPGAYVAQEFYRNVVVNVYAGIEWVIAGRFPLQLGFFTDFSSVPDIEGSSDTFDVAHINKFGGSIAFSVRHEGYDLGLGVTGVLGNGRSHRVNFASYDDPDEPTYVSTGVSTRTIYFFLHGALSSAKRAAVDVAEAIEHRGEDDEDETEEGDEEGSEEGTDESGEGAQDSLDDVEGVEELDLPTDEDNSSPQPIGE